jgi:hypothetical protein
MFLWTGRLFSSHTGAFDTPLVLLFALNTCLSVRPTQISARQDPTCGRDITALAHRSKTSHTYYSLHCCMNTCTGLVSSSFSCEQCAAPAQCSQRARPTAPRRHTVCPHARPTIAQRCRRPAAHRGSAPGRTYGAAGHADGRARIWARLEARERAVRRAADSTPSGAAEKASLGAGSLVASNGTRKT